MSEIVLKSGDLREDGRVELTCDFGGDAIHNLYTNKKWIVFFERNVKWDSFDNEYYYENEVDGTIFSANESNDILVTNLKVGRLFCKFEYTDLREQDHVIYNVFQVKPNLELIFHESIQGQKSDIEINYNLKNIRTDIYYGHNYSEVSDLDGKVSYTPERDGYFDYTVNVIWSNAKYNNDDDVIWESVPENKLTIPDGYFGGGVKKSNQEYYEVIRGKYLIKENIEDNIDFDISFSESVDNTIDAPLRGYFNDESNYGYDFENGIHRIEYIILDFGDGDVRKSYNINQFMDKTYKRSGEYNLTLEINTIHELEEITYRQKLSHTIKVTVDPFFGTFTKNLFNKTLFNSEGFNDMMNAWGAQMDRLYNEIQVLLESMDVEALDKKFIRSYAATYGDFEYIYRKIGFTSLSNVLESEDRFSYFKDYDIFERIETGDLTDQEKREFINYIQHTRERLVTKGTPVSIERIIANFALKAKVKELWTTYTGNDEESKIKIDEIFDGNKTINNTGITFKNVSMPYVDNEDNLIVDSKENSFIKINTIDNITVSYINDDTEKFEKNGETYFKIN
jgi:hypothetical protein